MNENGKNNLNIPNVKLVEIEDKTLEIPKTVEFGLPSNKDLSEEKSEKKEIGNWVIFLLLGIILLLSALIIYVLYNKQSDTIIMPDQSLNKPTKDDNDSKKELSLTLNGEATVLYNLGDEYTDLGAVAVDPLDGDITNLISISNNIDMNKPGIYQITYSVTNSNNENKEVTRQVIVANNNVTNLSISLDNNIVFLKKNEAFIDPGVKAFINNKDATKSVVKYDELDIKKEGIYNIVYVLSAENNLIYKTRKVVVYDNLDVVSDLELPNVALNYSKTKMTSDTLTTCDKVFWAFRSCDNNGTMSNDDINNCLLKSVKISFVNDINECTHNNYKITFDGELWKTTTTIAKKDIDPKMILQDKDFVYVYEEYNEMSLNSENWLISSCPKNIKTIPQYVDNKIYADSNHSEVIGYASCLNSSLNKNINKTTYYKHTFSKNSDNTYYWVSTEQI